MNSILIQSFTRYGSSAFRTYWHEGLPVPEVDVYLHFLPPEQAGVHADAGASCPTVNDSIRSVPVKNSPTRITTASKIHFVRDM